MKDVDNALTATIKITPLFVTATLEELSLAQSVKELCGTMQARSLRGSVLFSLYKEVVLCYSVD